MILAIARLEITLMQLVEMTLRPELLADQLTVNSFSLSRFRDQTTKGSFRLFSDSVLMVCFQHLFLNFSTVSNRWESRDLERDALLLVFQATFNH